MTSEQEFLLCLLKQAVCGKRLQNLPDSAVIDWKALVREANEQTVMLPLFDVISQLREQLPEEVYQKCFKLARQFTACNMRTEFAQAELVGELEKIGCPYVILKGETAATYYPVPELRQLGDVDFLVPLEYTETVKEHMVALGYRHSWEPGDYHQVLEKTGACLEMHMEVAGMPEGKTRGLVQAYLDSLYADSRLLDRGFGPFRAPGPAHHGLVLILHMQHHIVSLGMGLRHIMDWACFVDQTADEPFWQDSLLPLLKQVGLLRFTAVMTKMASVYLDSRCPQWAEAVEEKLCRDLMEDILSGGNFGRKDSDRARSIDMLPDYEKNEKKTGKLKLLYRTLYGSVVHQHPELKNKPVSAFFHMAGKTGRYLILYCQGKRPNLLKAASHADKRRELYEQLKMYETEN